MEHQICDSEWRRRLLESELSYWDRKSPSERQLWLENVSLRKFRKLIACEMSLLLENIQRDMHFNASALRMIRQRYLTLVVDIVMGERPFEALQKERDAITADLGKVYGSTPATTSKPYAKEQDALKSKEDLTFTDVKIDLFFSIALRSDRPGSRAASTG